MPSPTETMLELEHPDKRCPNCHIPVKYEAGFYDKKPLYRCPQCSYVIKPTSTALILALSFFGLLLLTLAVKFFGSMWPAGGF